MKTTIHLALIALAVAAAPAFGQKKDAVEIPFYGNETCTITGRPIDKELYVEHEGQRIYTCCKRCVGKIKAEPAVHLAKAYPKNKVVDLENEKCPIMGGKAKATVFTVFQGHKVHYCCKGCDKKFMKQPRKHLAMLKHKGLKDLGNKKCPVMPDESVMTDNFVIYKNQVINICCDDCAPKFKKSPEKYMKALKAGKPAPKKGR